MTEEIKYNKDEKWIPYKQLAETPQQTIARLEQENKDFEILAKSLYKKIEELEKENEALAFRERLYKADYEASERENKELKEKFNTFVEHSKTESDKVYYKMLDYKTALEEIRNNINNLPNEPLWQSIAECLVKIQDKINEVLNVKY